jgi:putative DNA primase/helicase
MVLGVDFSEARRRVMDAAGLSGETAARRIVAPAAVRNADVPEPAKPPRRVYQLCSTTCAPEDQSDAVFYLDSRKLWPLPDGCTWRAHASVDYFEEADEPGGRKRLAGRYPALVAGIVDRAGDLVTAHVTYLHEGRKLSEHEPRKILSKLTGREGCAARLMPASETLGIAEGIETALSAHKLHGLPVWAAINKSLLGKFEPPAGVRELVIFADRDEAGLDAACRLMERLQGRVRCAHRPPPSPHKDWNNVLVSGSQR